MQALLKKIITAHWLLALVILCVSFFIFSIMSYNLFFVLKANLEFIAEHGMDAVMEGGLMQLAELLAMSLVSAIFYVIFRACERDLVDKLLK